MPRPGAGLDKLWWLAWPDLFECHAVWYVGDAADPPDSGQSGVAGLNTADMNIHQITPAYFVAPQLQPSDLAEVAAAGFKCVICNRPDQEVSPAIQAEVMEEEAQRAGLKFVRLPLTHQTMTPGNVTKQMELIASTAGPVLAYCASGTRSTVIWALGQTGKMAVDDILATARAAGYDLQSLRPALEAQAASK